MASTEALADPQPSHDHHHDHDHPEFLAHHFDMPEQQFDAGKLGIWIFLVTEILFFSGMFCAYAVFRSLRPEVFEGCSEFLNTQLGAINTGVLLFSSLTMAWAVRCAQTEEYQKLTAMLAATLSCAMIFLGVKSIEYSHKWEMGLLPPRWYFYHPENPHPEGISSYLIYMALPFALGLIGLMVWFIKSKVTGNDFAAAVAKPLIVVFLCFFVGVGLGTVLEAEDHDDHHHTAAAHQDEQDEALLALAPTRLAVRGTTGEKSILERLAADETNTGIAGDLAARRRQSDVAGSSVVPRGTAARPIAEMPTDVNTASRAGVFFGIYYCMTGVHAIHILAGVGVLIWLLVRSVRMDFNRQYFGPVDYVGLYWHIVDLIWIYLFPLLYLIR